MPDRKIELRTFPEAKGHHFRLITGPTGKTAFVFMDGVMLEGVTDVRVDVSTSEPTRIHISFIAASINEEDPVGIDPVERAAIKVIDNDKDLEQLIRRSIEEGDVSTDRFRELLLKKARGLT